MGGVEPEAIWKLPPACEGGAERGDGEKLEKNVS